MQGISVTLDELLNLRHLAEQIRLPHPNSSRSIQSGNYQSPFRGRGMDFVENRVYQPGDDIRSINWAVTARTGKAHTKVYQQERERPVYIILDLNETMFFGTKVAYKSVTAAHAATLIAWAALKNGDRIGSLLVKEANHILPPGHGKQNLVELLKNIVKVVAPGPASYSGLGQGLKKLKHTIKSGSLIFLFSDFYHLDESLKEELQHLAKYHDITNVLIYDPLEKSPPVQGRYLFHDFHQHQSILLDTYSKKVCVDYSEIYAQKVNCLKKLCYATGMQMLELATNDELAKIIRQVLLRKMF